MPTLAEPQLKPNLESVTLYYRAGGSDNVYRCQIQAAGSRFVVNFAQGRRGSTMNTGTQTNVPVDYASAQRIFARSVKAMRGKGYSPGADEY